MEKGNQDGTRERIEDTADPRTDQAGTGLSEYPRMDSDCRAYGIRFGHLDAVSRDIYSGEGQCSGRLVTDGNRIVVCCCASLADSLCFGGAHIHEGRLYMGPDSVAYSDDGEGGEYIVPPDRAPALRTCPYCGSPLLRCRGVATNNYNHCIDGMKESAI